MRYLSALAVLAFLFGCVPQMAADPNHSDLRSQPPGVFSSERIQLTFDDTKPVFDGVFKFDMAAINEGEYRWFVKRKFVECEFSRMESDFPECFALCTMQLGAGRNLLTCCRQHDVPFDEEAHHALADARAAARLLVRLLSVKEANMQNLADLRPIQWPKVSRSDKQPVTRDQSRRRQAEPPGYLQRLLGLRNDSGIVVTDGAMMAYRDLIDRVLEDRRVDDAEAASLVEMATRYGLSGEQVAIAHREYLNELAVAAWADGVVTETELRDLRLVSRLLGIDESNFEAALTDAAEKTPQDLATPSLPQANQESFAGKSVCFTGEMQCSQNGELLSRERGIELATNAGLVVAASVTKKLDILVVSDPNTQSGKAKKARQYGVRIMHEPVFWKAIGISVE